jgi:hypothetical protein
MSVSRRKLGPGARVRLCARRIPRSRARHWPQRGRPSRRRHLRRRLRGPRGGCPGARRDRRGARCPDPPRVAACGQPAKIVQTGPDVGRPSSGETSTDEEPSAMLARPTTRLSVKGSGVWSCSFLLVGGAAAPDGDVMTCGRAARHRSSRRPCRRTRNGSPQPLRSRSGIRRSTPCRCARPQFQA